MASSITFFDDSSSHPKYSKKSDKYFSSVSAKPIVKKIDKEEETTKLMRWLKLTPALILIALSAAFLPHFGLACAVTIGVLFSNLIIVSIIGMFVKTKPTKELSDAIKNKQLLVSLGGPALEELFFRGALLQLSLLLIGLAFPPALLLPFLNLGISVAAATAILITAIPFGLMHAGNAEKNGYPQVVATFLYGLAFGFFAVQFGLLVAIGAHVLNNTIICSVLNLSSTSPKKSEEPKEEKAPQLRMA